MTMFKFIKTLGQKTLNSSDKAVVRALKLFAFSGLYMGLATMSARANGIADDVMRSFSQCELVISEVSQRTQNKYDPLSSYDYLQPIALKIRNVGSKTCSGTIGFQSSTGSDALTGGNSDSLSYLLVGEYNLNSVLFNPLQQSQARLSINLKGGRSVQFNPRLYIPRGQSATSGQYDSQIDIVFLEHGKSFEKRMAFHFGAYVRASVQANFVGVDRLRERGRHGVVKLGELTPGLRRTIGLQLRSNSNVDVSISSENHGALAHNSLADIGIGYNMRIGGHDINLSSREEIVLPADLSRDGLTNSIEVELDDYGNAPAGRYGDLIHVRVSAR